LISTESSPHQKVELKETLQESTLSEAHFIKTICLEGVQRFESDGSNEQCNHTS